jgi:hypothetical protein
MFKLSLIKIIATIVTLTIAFGFLISQSFVTKTTKTSFADSPISRTLTPRQIPEDPNNIDFSNYNCEGNSTVLYFSNQNKDLLVSSVNGYDDFNYQSSSDANRVLKVKFDAKDPLFKGTNNIRINISSKNPKAIASILNTTISGVCDILTRYPKTTTSTQTTNTPTPPVGNPEVVNCPYNYECMQPIDGKALKAELLTLPKNEKIINFPGTNNNFRVYYNGPYTFAESDYSESIKIDPVDYYIDRPNIVIFRNTNTPDYIKRLYRPYFIPDRSSPPIPEQLILAIYNEKQTKIPSSNQTYLAPSYPNLPNLLDNWQLQPSTDFNNDGSVDVLWRNKVDGTLVIWYLNGKGNFLSGTNNPIAGDATIAGVKVSPSSGWNISTIGDIDGDGNKDLVWSNTISGDRVIWYLNAQRQIVSGDVLPYPSKEWEIVASVDTNNDKKDDLIFRHKTAGHIVLWRSNRIVNNKGENEYQILGGALLTTLDISKTIYGAYQSQAQKGTNKYTLQILTTSTGLTSEIVFDGVVLAG